MPHAHLSGDSSDCWRVLQFLPLMIESRAQPASRNHLPDVVSIRAYGATQPPVQRRRPPRSSSRAAGPYRDATTSFDTPHPMIEPLPKAASRNHPGDENSASYRDLCLPAQGCSQSVATVCRSCYRPSLGVQREDLPPLARGFATLNARIYQPRESGRMTSRTISTSDSGRPAR